MAEETVLGLEAKLFYATDVATANWAELTNVKNVTLGLEKEEADVTTRANSGWRATRGTLKNATVEFEMVWKTTDDGFTAIKDAWLNNTVIGLAILDGNSGGQGFQADFNITGFSRNEELTEALTVSVTAKPSASQSWVTSFAGA